jgi:hypothetical protein
MRDRCDDPPGWALSRTPVRYARELVEEHGQPDNGRVTIDRRLGFAGDVAEPRGQSLQGVGQLVAVQRGERGS